MIGVANREWIECSYMLTDTPTDFMRFSTLYTPSGIINTWILFNLSGIPKSRGGKKLYVDGAKVMLYDADVNNYLSRMIVRWFTDTANSHYLDDATNKTTIDVHEYSFTASDISAKESVIVYFNIVSDSASNIKFNPPSLRCYYA